MFPNEARQAIPSKGLLAPSSPSIGCSLTQTPSIWANSRQLSGTYCTPPSKELLGDYFILTSMNWKRSYHGTMRDLQLFLNTFNKNRKEYSKGIGPKVKDKGQHSLSWSTNVYLYIFSMRISICLFFHLSHNFLPISLSCTFMFSVQNSEVPLIMFSSRSLLFLPGNIFYIYLPFQRKNKLIFPLHFAIHRTNHWTKSAHRFSFHNQENASGKKDFRRFPSTYFKGTGRPD